MKRQASSAPLVTAEDLVITAGRALLPLDGRWRLCLDPFDEGFAQNWPALDERPRALWDGPRDYTIEGGAEVEVPSCWNMNRPEWRAFEGTGWYTRAFAWTPGPAGERTVLHVGAATGDASVFLNGACLARHRGGSTPFCVELTHGLRAGANRLHIAVDNRRAPDRIPPERFDWFNYGGLYRSVSLLRLPRVFIKDFSCALVPDGARFSIRIALKLSDPVPGSAVVSIPDLSISTAIPVIDGEGEAVLSATPELWSPSRPRLYDVEARFGADRVAERVGLRDIRADGATLLLNGAPVFLKGVCVHEDDVALGKTTTEADLRRRLAHARELGANFLRLAHDPHDPRAAAIADELGFLLWCEIPVYWDVDFGNAATFADARNQLAELVRRDRNRASVILWSLANETPVTAERTRFLAALAAEARRLDATRLVTAACTLADGRLADPLASSLDVVGINEYFGWYDPDLAGLARFLATLSGEKPVIVSEFGADAVAGLRDDAEGWMSEDRQAAIYRAQLAALLPHPAIAGVSPWILYDFRSERRQTDLQQGFNRKGLLAEDKATRKRAFGILAEAYRGLLR